MKQRLIVLGLALAGGLATPAFAIAAPCTTPSTPGAAVIAFPKADGTDLNFARSMLAGYYEGPAAALMARLCERGKAFSTAQGDYVLTGENSDAQPRRAVPDGDRAGAIVYLSSPDPQTAPNRRYELIVDETGGIQLVKRFYAGIPDDETLFTDVKAALADRSAFIAMTTATHLVQYGFDPGAGSNGVPPPLAAPLPLPGGTIMTQGPQVLISSTNPGEFVDMSGGGVRHKPSGLACPINFTGAAIQLDDVDPAAGKVVCSYKVGTNLAYEPDAQLRYQLSFINAPTISAEQVYNQIHASGAESGGAERPAPLAVGPSPEPAFATFFQLPDGSVGGSWIAKVGAWIVLLQATYQASPANDAEAAIVARQIFSGILGAPSAP